MIISSLRYRTNSAIFILQILLLLLFISTTTAKANFTSVWTDTYDATLVDWGDYDEDGDLDFAIGDKDGFCGVYRNNGDDTFTLKWTNSVSLKERVVDWRDYDGDGEIDLLLGADGGNNFVYRHGSSSYF